MIRAEDVADLQPGDVVEVIETCCGDEITTRGPVRREGDYLNLGNSTLVRRDGEPASWYHTLTVVSRAPRPLYVNHDRTEPCAGDVMADPFGGVWTWCPLSSHTFRWRSTASDEWIAFDDMGDGPLRLLVDGTTGQVVP